MGDDARDVREHPHQREALAGGKVLERGATVRLPLLTGPVRILGVGARLLFELPGKAVLAQPAGAQPFDRAAVPEIEVAQAQIPREEPAEVEEELTGEHLRDRDRLRFGQQERRHDFERDALLARDAGDLSDDVAQEIGRRLVGDGLRRGRGRVLVVRP